jgi:hypothetical protein
VVSYLIVDNTMHSPRAKLPAPVILTIAILALGLSVPMVKVRWLPKTVLPPRVQASALGEFSSARPETGLGLVFFHHDLGGQWLADPGSDPGQRIDGGGLRRLLARDGYLVHTATVGSALGQQNYLLYWQRTFASRMDDVLRIDRQDRVLPQPERNRIVIFKSCADNSRFVGPGVEPGSPDGPELTVANAKASFKALLRIFRTRPDTLFVFVTTPPFALPKPQVLGKILAAKVLGRVPGDERLHASGLWARQFHDWVVASRGWLAEYPLTNVAVFDLNDHLTEHGSSLFLAHPGFDDRPRGEDMQAAATDFGPWLNRAVRRANLSSLTD